MLKQIAHKVKMPATIDAETRVWLRYNSGVVEHLEQRCWTLFDDFDDDEAAESYHYMHHTATIHWDDGLVEREEWDIDMWNDESEHVPPIFLLPNGTRLKCEGLRCLDDYGLSIFKVMRILETEYA